MLPEDVSNLLASAQACVQAHDYHGAVALYKDALARLDPQTAVPDLKENRLYVLRECGRLLGILGDQETALALHQQYQQEAGETRNGLIGLIYIGQHLRGLGRYQDALHAYEKALALAEQLQDADGQARSLMGIGSTYLVQGATEQALDCFTEAYEHFAASGNIQGQVQMANLTGVAQATGGQFEKAIRAFHNGLKMARQLRLHEREAVLLNNLGECYQLLFASEQALACHQEGLALVETARLRLVEADLCRNIGIDLCYLGRVDEGLEYLQRALSISQTTGNVDIEQYTLAALSLHSLCAAITRWRWLMPNS
ncbi:MAG: tetratricopeptide repeat protein [Chloroflexota bacterium]